jgi:peptidoglycan/LPS O-acetylase OafA/YrhL
MLANPMKALPNLDFIRAVAVLSVVVEHVLLSLGIRQIGSWEVDWIGVVGVFIFFVHTSLVLMWSLERKPHTLDFYIRRFFRIYPLAIAVIVIALIFHAPVSGTPTPHTFRALLSAFLLTNNLTSSYVVVGVMWSLSYEVQMYLALPVIFFFVRKNFSLWPLLIFWSFVVVACRPLFRGVPHNFFLCIPYFLPGVMAYVGFSRYRPRIPAWILPIALVIAWALFMRNPGWRRADVLCLAVGLGLPLFHQITARWSIRASHEIAKYSYSIYLIHPFSIVLGIYLLPHRPLALQITVIVVSLVVLSVAAYHLLEKPMIRLGARLAKRAEKRFEQYDATVKRHPPETNKLFEPLPTK